MKVFGACILLALCLAAEVSADRLQWHTFSLTNKRTLLTDFSNKDIERFYVKFPCSDTIWFKLFLQRRDGPNPANSHVELKNRKRGNIFCKGAGNKRWYGGARTDFTISENMQCESDGSNIILVVEKTDKRVTIKNRGKVLYNQVFKANDGNCKNPTAKVITQVWEYNKDLKLAVFDKNTRPCGTGKKCTGILETACGAGKKCSGGVETACGAGKKCSGGVETACGAGKLCTGGVEKACPADNLCANGAAKACFGGSKRAASASKCTKTITKVVECTTDKCTSGC